MKRLAELTLRVLGELAVERDGLRLPLPPSKKTRALLGYLVAEPREHTREQLCALLWEAPDDPRGALRWSLSRLRPLLGGACLVADRERLQLCAGQASVDLYEAQALRAALAAAGEAALRRGCALFRGELLEGLDLPGEQRYSAWLLGQREAARRLHGQLLAALADRLSAQPEEALPVARRLLEHDPADEDAHRRVMRLLSALGRHKQAARQYDALRDVLKPLGLRPSAETEALRAAPSAGRLAATPPATPAARPSPLIAREEELQATEAALGSARLTLLLGEAGIGKTRLLEEVAGRARAAGAQVLAGRSYQPEMSRPFGPFIDALRGSALLAWADERLRGGLAPLLPELAPAPGAADKAGLYDAVAELLRRAAGQGRVVLLLDDLQWIDEASAALAHFLARTLPPQSFALLAAAREGELQSATSALRLLRGLQREGLSAEVLVPPLAPEAVGQLLRSRGLSADPHHVHQGSGGNPLFALEMGSALHQGRSMSSGSLAELLELRLSAPGPEAQALLPWGAALGRSFTPALLGAAAQLPPLQLQEAFAALEHHGLLRARQDGASYDFAHDLLREAALRRVPVARRRALHEGLAQALWQAPQGQGALAGEVVRHALLSGDDALAVRASVAAARHALQVFALDEAQALAERALPLCRALPREEALPARLALLQAAILARPGAGALASAVRELGEVVLEAEAAGMADLASQGFHLLSWGHSFREDEAAAFLGSMKSAEAARQSADPLVRARALAQAGRCLAQIEREPARAAALLAEAAQAAGALEPSVLDLFYGRGLLLAHAGRSAEARAELMRGADLAHAAVDHWRESECLFALCKDALEAGEPQRALELAERISPVAERLSGGHEPAHARGLCALAQLTVRASAAAARSFEEACGELQKREGFWRLATLRLLHAELSLRAGQLDEAERSAAAAQALAPGEALQLRAGRCELVLAEIALARGQQGPARSHLTRAVAGATSFSARERARISQAAAALGLGAPAQASALPPAPHS